MIPCDTDDLVKTYNTLENELEAYNPELLDKPRVVAITKSDLIDEELKGLLRRDLPSAWNPVFISSITQTGLSDLKDALWSALQSDLGGE